MKVLGRRDFVTWLSIISAGLFAGCSWRNNTKSTALSKAASLPNAAGADPLRECQRLQETAAPPFQVDQVWNNWGIVDMPASTGGQLFTPKLFRPRTPYELASAIRDAEHDGQTIRALGSGWSFSDAAIPQSSDIPVPWGFWYPFKYFGYAIDTTDLSSSLQTTLPTLLRNPQDAETLFFVEAGVKLHALNDLLDQQQPRKALKTLGGSSGQSLAGAISTGTHGGDFDRPPLADSVRAIYLIGAGGTHHWIEPLNSITERSKISAAFPCIGKNIHYDDNMFRAALVSMGSMGVIYSVVLDVVPQYSLVQVNKWGTWEELKAQTGPFLGEAMTGGWTEILNIVLSHLPPQQQTVNLSNRFLQVVVNPIRNDDGTHNCYVSNRVEVPLQPAPSGVTPADLSGVTKDDFTNAIKGSPDCQLGCYIAFGLSNITGNTILEQAASLITFCEGYGYYWAIRAVVDMILQNAFPLPNPGPQTDIGYKVMTGGVLGTNFPRLGVTSIEVAFFLPDAIKFVDTILSAFDAAVGVNHFPAGYISLRVCGQTSALLGMQRFQPTGMVEISLLGASHGPELVVNSESAALQNNPTGILHWGQSSGLTNASQISKQFPNLPDWVNARRTLGGNTFVNQFVRRCGLV